MTIDLRQRVKEVLEKGYFMSLGTADQGGVWVCDVLYVYDGDLKMYWTSSPRVRHSLAIEANGKVAGSITVNGAKEDNLGIQLEGTARKLSSLRPDLVMKIFMKRKRIVPADIAEAMKGRSWYELTPSKVELIDEKNFGYKKQSLPL